MTEKLEKVRGLLAVDDVRGSIFVLRDVVGTGALPEIAAITRELAAYTGFEDLSKAAAVVASGSSDPDAFLLFGFDCIERGLSFAAIPALRAALRGGTSKPALALGELVTALEDEHLHWEAVAALLEQESILRPWPERYLLVYNSIMSGDLGRARAEFARLPEPDDERWVPTRDRVRRMLERADLVGELGAQDLRGWHFALTGGYLATVSPWGYASGMNGRWAYLGDNPALCRNTLDRAAQILRVAGQTPRSVSLLPNHSDRILGLAAAELFGLPAEPYAPGRPDTLVVAHDLNNLEPEVAVTLRERASGQILFEHATCWTNPPVVTADISGLLVQMVEPGWGPQRRLIDGEMVLEPGDARPDTEIAADIVHADPTPDPGDGETPPDPDDILARLVTVTRDAWLTGPRDRVNSPGPVPSSRFL
ncbi:hypothetical protein ACFXHA_28270 [Nocardia sp. NPDC059240]|uniref:hypothetical protein n=1 Tax=Nocardia sp. NPDC059240 TaxID=3346786 RepID=UPI0036B82454